MFGPLNEKEQALIGRLPPVTRARGPRLYCLDGTRWLDLWLDGGRALAGHRPKGVSLRLKNEIDRGLYAPYPSLWMARLEKSLLRMFPGYETVRIYRNAERAVEVLGLEIPPVDPLDLPLELKSSPGALWGRPGLPDHPAADILFPILPLVGLSEVQPVLFASDAGDAPASDAVSSVIAAAMTRSCSAINDEILDKRPLSSEIWKRRGPFMIFQGDDKDYSEVFEALFARRILIAPSRTRPSVFSSDISARDAEMISRGGI